MYHLWWYRNIAGVVRAVPAKTAQTQVLPPKDWSKRDQSMIKNRRLDWTDAILPLCGITRMPSSSSLFGIIGVIGFGFSCLLCDKSWCFLGLTVRGGGKGGSGHYWVIGGSPSDKGRGWTKAFAFFFSMEKSITGESLEMHNGHFSAFCFLSYENSSITLLLLSCLNYSSLHFSFSFLYILPHCSLFLPNIEYGA